MSPRGPGTVALTLGFTSLRSHPVPSLRWGCENTIKYFFLASFSAPRCHLSDGCHLSDAISPMGAISHMITVVSALLLLLLLWSFVGEPEVDVVLVRLVCCCVLLPCSLLPNAEY